MNKLKLLMCFALVSCTFILCSCDKDDSIDGTGNSNASVTITAVPSGSSGRDYKYYECKTTAKGVSASDITWIGVEAEPVSSSSGYVPGVIKQAGFGVLSASCMVKLQKGYTYKVYGAIIVNGNKTRSNPKTIKIN